MKGLHHALYPAQYCRQRVAIEPFTYQVRASMVRYVGAPGYRMNNMCASE